MPIVGHTCSLRPRASHGRVGSCRSPNGDSRAATLAATCLVPCGPIAPPGPRLKHRPPPEGTEVRVHDIATCYCAITRCLSCRTAWGCGAALDIAGCRTWQRCCLANHGPACSAERPAPRVAPFISPPLLSSRCLPIRSTVVYRGPSETRAPMSQIMYQPARFSGELVTPDDVDVEVRVAVQRHRRCCA